MSDRTPFSVQPEAQPSALLSVDDLSVSYGGGEGRGAERVEAVRKVSFDIGTGEVVGLVGESGSGKSTIAQAILGLLDKNTATIKGRIQFADNNLFALDTPRWREIRGRRIGMIFQSPESSFNPVASIGEQMIEALRWQRKLSKQEAKQTALSALQELGMPRPEEVMHNYAFELSGGMCQRAALAMVMALAPSLILADEPTASLDVVAQAELIRWLAAVQKKRGFSMLVISHDLNLIARLSDRLLVMHQGRILERGTTQSVLDHPQHDYTKTLINAVPRLTEPALRPNSTPPVNLEPQDNKPPK